MSLINDPKIVLTILEQTKIRIWRDNEIYFELDYDVTLTDQLILNISGMSPGHNQPLSHAVDGLRRNRRIKITNITIKKKKMINGRYKISWANMLNYQLSLIKKCKSCIIMH